MRSIGVEAQFLAFNTGIGKPEIIVRRSDVVAVKPHAGGFSCTLLLRGGADVEIQENVNAVLTMLTYTPD